MRFVAFVLALSGCTAADGVLPGVHAAGAGPSGGLDANPCALGTACHPIPIDVLPFEDARDTADAPSSTADVYACAPGVDESGPEWFYVLETDATGVVSASVDDLGAGGDPDLHLLEDRDPASCLTRGHRVFARVIPAGRHLVTVDTWVDGAGAARTGPYALTVDWWPLPETGPCAFDPVDLRMYWTGCDPGLACEMQGATAYLTTPAAGPVVKEAHLVTVDDGFGAAWPVAFTDGIDRHYALSEAASGYAMARTEPWAPAGEGGSMYGQGSTGGKLPVLDEAWYVNMHWRDRPAKGTRMLVMNPFDGRAVVAAGGWETGPGANTAIGGATEEIHDALGTGHRDLLVMGFAADPALPLGPVTCD